MSASGLNPRFKVLLREILINLNAFVTDAVLVHQGIQGENFLDIMKHASKVSFRSLIVSMILY